MKIENIDLNDKSFLDILKKYLVESQPYQGFSSDMSKSYLNKRVQDFVKSDLAECDIGTYFISGDGDALFFLFCKKDNENKKLEIIFPFPNLNVLDYNSWSTWPFSFCHLMLDQLNRSGFDGAYGEIQRRNKEKNYEKALLRFGHKMFEVSPIEGKRYKKVIINKDNLEKAHTKLGRIYKKG